ncbi:bifunctional 4-hydroxy-2-oxoglutarate aldolase/2-dehydro-3-deoxy-phosphogluconate aldolase [Paracoccus sp. p4-l81]|uniref:bifunctional 4-hydroxy-2-oxoglutarate aldolase/2-dehydro-3-deoxy-phosphogluconate aldolase n=1 Tax=unclassified Paracoccus (in: a-proteobacteria) TaxID=2688777 RepID=UPI0035BB4E2C
MTPAQQSQETRRICALAPVVPVLVVKDAGRAEGLARALVAGGLPALEVTLRTPAALDAIRAMAAVPGGVVGAGTLLTPADVRAAKNAGARFGVSPGATPALIGACVEFGLPLLPGAATASEAMALLEQGFDMLKLFPAEAVGGRNLLKSLGGPLPQISFCPTGGITEATAPDYLALSNVACVGGSWIAPDADVAAGNWDAIAARAKAAAALG